jgi:hypothetical protein
VARQLVAEGEELLAYSAFNAQHMTAMAQDRSIGGALLKVFPYLQGIGSMIQAILPVVGMLTKSSSATPVLNIKDVAEWPQARVIWLGKVSDYMVILEGRSEAERTTLADWLSDNPLVATVLSDLGLVEEKCIAKQPPMVVDVNDITAIAGQLSTALEPVKS